MPTIFSSGLTRQLMGVMIFVVVLAVAGLGLTAYASERNALQEQIAHLLSSLADLKGQALEVWLQEREADVELLAVNYLNQEHFSELFDPDIAEARKAEFSAFLADNLRGLQQARVGYSEIAMVDSRGNVRISTDQSAIGRPAQYQALVAQTLASSDGHAWQDIYRNAETGRIEMVWGRQIRAIDLKTKEERAEAIGVLIAVIDVEKTIYPLLGPLPLLGDSAESLLVRREGEEILFLSPLLFHQESPMTLRIPVTSESGVPAIRSSRGESGIIESRDYRGVPVLAAYRPVTDKGWGFIVKQDQAQAYAPVQDLTRRMISWSLLVVLATGLLALLLAGRLTRPLVHLAQVSQRVAAGDLHIQLHNERPDEIGALARAFQAMVSGLRQRQEQEAALQCVLELLNSSHDFLRIFPRVAEELRQHLGFARMSLFVFDEGEQTFHLLVTDPPMPNGVSQAFSVQQTPMAAAAQANYLHYAPDLATYQSSALDRLFYQKGVRSRVAAPLRVEEKTVGMIGLGWAEVAGYEAEKLFLLEQVSGSLALALERWRLFGEVERRMDELGQAYRELQQADELKSEFIRNITHELRTPVTIVSGFAELLLYDDHANLLAEQVEMLTTVHTHSQQLARLVNDVVVLQQLQTQARQEAPVLIVELAEQSLREIRNNLTSEQSERYRFALECPERGVAVQGDGEQLARVFANLLNNAVKFSPDGFIHCHRKKGKRNHRKQPPVIEKETGGRLLLINIHWSL